MKVTAVIASSVICLVLGIGIGIVGATYARLTTADLAFWGGGGEGNAEADGEKRPPPVEIKGAMPKGGMGGMGKGPSAKAQLNSLITKLDILTEKPLTLSFDKEQKKKIQEHLQGLAMLEELTEDDAKKRLDGLLDIVKDQKEPLTVVGFRWPGVKGGGFGAPKDVPNPFKEEAGAKHLESFEQRLAKSAP